MGNITLRDPAPATAAATLKSVALAHFQALETPMRALAERYRAVAFDLVTPKGLAAAKAARNDLRENGRYAVQRAEKAVKDELNDLKRAISPKVEALVAIIQPVEDHVHGQIEAREAQLAAEKAERERLEAERVAEHRATIARIAGWGEQSTGKAASQIAGAIEMIESRQTIGPEFEEFEPEARAALEGTLARLRAAYTDALAREQEAARIEAQRIEQARVAAEQAERQRELDAQAAALKKQQAEIEAQARAAAAREAEVKRMAEAQEQAERQRIEREEVTKRAAEAAEAARLVIPPEATALIGQPAPVAAAPIEPTEAVAPAAPTVTVVPAPAIALQQIDERLAGLYASAELLGQLGFAGQSVGATVFYPAEDFPLICAALAQHCITVGQAHKPRTT